MVANMSGIATIVSVQMIEPTHATVTDAMVRDMFQTLAIRREVPESEKLAVLPYKIGNLAKFRIVRSGYEGVAILTYEPAATDPSQLSIVHQAQPDGPGLTACWLQAEPARQLPRLARLPILHLLSESSYHAPYDHCTTKWLNQAGVATDFVKVTDLGIFGNGHLMAVEKNSGFSTSWQARMMRSFSDSSAYSPLLMCR